MILHFSWAGYRVSRETALLADAEPRENLSEKVVRGELPGDSGQGRLGLPQILGEHFRLNRGIDAREAFCRLAKRGYMASSCDELIFADLLQGKAFEQPLRQERHAFSAFRRNAN